MKKYSIAVVDYGFGNHASVVHSLKDIGFMVKVTKSKSDLDSSDILILPGVGAFPSAMNSLHDLGLDKYLCRYASLGRPLIGICLGMQLLVDASYENKYSTGLGLIPGNIKPFANNCSHIGWNTIDVLDKESRLNESHKDVFYFNHSYYYHGPVEYQVAMTENSELFPSIIRSGQLVGLQFHPEKSQFAGKVLLKNLIKDLINA